jgi:hypothetical protein
LRRAGCLGARKHFTRGFLARPGSEPNLGQSDRRRTCLGCNRPTPNSVVKPCGNSAFREKALAMNPALVLSTVNAPHSAKLTAQQLADCLHDQEKARAMPGHMSVFFGEVDPALQLDFASQFGSPRPRCREGFRCIFGPALPARRVTSPGESTRIRPSNQAASHHTSYVRLVSCH